MTTVLGDKLQEVFPMMNQYIWKGPKDNNGIQEEIKLIDCNYDQLSKFYRHCMQMLYNTDIKNPGRKVLFDIVKKQIYKCRAELLIRYLRREKEYTPQKCLEDLRNIRAKNKNILTDETIKTYPIGKIMTGLPIEYNDIPVELVMDACLDILGVLDCSHLTLNFITRLGLYFTQQEMQQPVKNLFADGKHGLYEKDPETGKAKNRLEIIKRELKMNPAIELKISTTGLTYNEFRSMYYFKKDKYSNLTSDLLKLLSNKVLYRFQQQCLNQSQQWENKIQEILEVAEYKGWDVTRDIN
jgi:hypothetical protein